MVDIAGAVLVTGCSTGIGRATALRLSRAGFTVWASARQVESIEDLAGHGCRTVALDVCDEQSMADAVAAVEEAHGAVWGLVNNAGYGQQGPFELTDPDDARRQFETNIIGPARLCQLVLPAMRAAGRGRIVMMGSMGGRITFPGGAYYHATKYALEGFSDVLRWEVAHLGIDVVVVQPGAVTTEFGRTSLSTLSSIPTDPSEAGPYGAFTASIDRALRSTFEHQSVDGATTADEVALVVESALGAERPATRYVVGEMASMLMSMRASSTDAEWDAFCDTIYTRPSPT